MTREEAINAVKRANGENIPGDGAGIPFSVRELEGLTGPLPFNALRHVRSLTEEQR
jgi:hypothetical protein